MLFLVGHSQLKCSAWLSTSSMPSSGKHNEEEEDEVYHVGMEIPLSVCGVFNLRLPEVITKARVVAATDSSSGEEDGGSVSRKKKKKSGGAQWVITVCESFNCF